MKAMEPADRELRPPLALQCLAATLALAVAAFCAAAPAAAATTFTVDSAVDAAAVGSTSDGVCDADPDVDVVSCTLRAAVQESNGRPGVDLISVPRLEDDYKLGLTGGGENQAARGDLDLNDSVSIVGADQPRIDGLLADRVFDVGSDGDVEPVVTIRGLDLARGRVTGSGAEGGGVLVRSGRLALKSVSIEDSVARGSGARGGGVWLASGGQHLIEATTIAGNLAESTSASAAARAGGIGSEGDAELTNVTLSGNVALNDVAIAPSVLGGGAYQAPAGLMKLTQSTLADNAALSAVLDDTAGGNLVADTGGEVQLRGTIVADGSAGPGTENCFENGAEAAITSLGGNLEAHASAPAGQCDPRPDLRDHSSPDARLVPLDDQGGPTETRALANGSPALESVPYCWPVRTDQRGLRRPSGYACDAGAFERQQPLPPDRCFGRPATMFGTAGEQRILGTPRADVIVAFAQSDKVFGGAGNDRICGGRGNDLLRGGPGNDRLSGGLLGDRLFGDGGHDLLFGNFGEDRLNGGRGRDLLQGGPGRDRCRRAHGDTRRSC